MESLVDTVFPCKTNSKLPVNPPVVMVNKNLIVEEISLPQSCYVNLKGIDFHTLEQISWQLNEHRISCCGFGDNFRKSKILK